MVGTFEAPLDQITSIILSDHQIGQVFFDFAFEAVVSHLLSILSKERYDAARRDVRPARDFLHHSILRSSAAHGVEQIHKLDPFNLFKQHVFHFLSFSHSINT